MLSLGRWSIQAVNPSPKGKCISASLGFIRSNLNPLSCARSGNASLYHLPAFCISTGRPGRCPMAITVGARRCGGVGQDPPAQPGCERRGGGGFSGASLPAIASDLPALQHRDGVAKNAIVSQAQPGASVCLRIERNLKGNYSISVLTFSSYSFSEPKEMAVALCGS